MGQPLWRSPQPQQESGAEGGWGEATVPFPRPPQETLQLLILGLIPLDPAPAPPPCVGSTTPPPPCVGSSTPPLPCVVRFSAVTCILSLCSMSERGEPVIFCLDLFRNKFLKF